MLARTTLSPSVRSLALALLALGATAGTAAAEPLALGAAPPRADVKLTNVDGKALTLAEAAGPKGTLVVFTCNHCPYAKKWEARVAALGNEYAAQGIGVVAVNSNDEKAYPEDAAGPMKERAAKLGLKFPYVIDATSDVARAFGATRTPEVFLFDAGRKLVYHGAIDDNADDAAKVTRHYLKDALAAVVAGKTPPVAETKSIGCSIKFRGAK